MAHVTLAGGASGSDVVLSARSVFYIESGEVEFSTDTGVTWIPFFAGDKVMFENGLTVRNRNMRTQQASFAYMPM